MEPLSEQKCVMIIAGEASGDLHGSKLVSAMRKRNKTLYFCGIGGQALKDVGVKILVDASKLAVVGITEAFSKMPDLLKGMAVAKKTLKTLHPDLLILIDFPDFNLNVAATAKKLGIPVLYYISPQIWAWRPGRVRKIGKLVDHMAVILPFEEEFYRKHEIPVTFVGHPLLDANLPTQDTALEKPVEDIPAIGLLPGSRDREITRHLPVMLDAAKILLRKIKNVKFIISLAPDVERKYVEEIIKKHKAAADFELVADSVDKILKRSSFVVAASGTVTLESAIFGTPMVIIYKVSPVSYWLGRSMIRVKHIGLANLIAGKEIVPELLQDEASPGRIAETVFKMLSDAPGLERLRLELLSIRDAMGGSGASERVADIALTML
ncbi:MAG: lipid-A-disaccharide synthase [Desulfobacterales bacterium PC51MH44]|nr:MAG: lipid-A-disaccharide synthase [Desulfobacterales bacterium PC51MH44]